jgi:hypothetical protein
MPMDALAAFDQVQFFLCAQITSKSALIGVDPRQTAFQL